MPYAGRVQLPDGTGAPRDVGSARLRELIRGLGPTAHFFGHYHQPHAEAPLANHQGGVTRSVGLNQVCFEGPEAPLPEGCFGVLRVDGPGQLRYQEVTDTWLRDLRGSHCAVYL